MRQIQKVVNKIRLDEQISDFAFWQKKSYEERLAALENLRTEYNSWKYGTEQRFQRVYRIIKQK